MNSFSLDTICVDAVLGTEGLSAYEQGDLPEQVLKPYVAALKELSSWYVGARTSPFRLTRTHAEAFTLYFMLLNARKWFWLSSRIDFRRRTHEAATILDYGSGPGTATLALRLAGLKVGHQYLVDTCPEMRSMARRLFDRSKCGVAEIRADIPAQCVADAILCSNVFNESSPAEAQRVLLRLFSLLRPGGIVAIVEPALQQISRNLMGLRDWVLTEVQEVQVIFPCTHSQACPMLRANQRDWCHTQIPGESPRIVQQLDRLTGFNKHRLKFSTLVLQKGASVERRQNSFRVIEDVRRDKRGYEALVCGASFYGPALLPKRARVQSTEDFVAARSYANLSLDISPEGRVQAAQLDESLR